MYHFGESALSLEEKDNTQNIVNITCNQDSCSFQDSQVMNDLKAMLTINSNKKIRKQQIRQHFFKENNNYLKLELN